MEEEESDRRRLEQPLKACPPASGGHTIADVRRDVPEEVGGSKWNVVVAALKIARYRPSRTCDSGKVLIHRSDT